MRSRPTSYPPPPVDLSALQPSWAVVSLSVSDDLATLFITRHQRNVSPVVLCLPFDRQGRRDIDEVEGAFGFGVARDEMEEIVRVSDETARKAKGIKTAEGKAEWWETRYALDRRLGELLGMMEGTWLGAFKVSRQSARGSAG